MRKSANRSRSKSRSRRQVAAANENAEPTPAEVEDRERLWKTIFGDDPMPEDEAAELDHRGRRSWWQRLKEWSTIRRS